MAFGAPYGELFVAVRAMGVGLCLRLRLDGPGFLERALGRAAPEMRRQATFEEAPTAVGTLFLFDLGRNIVLLLTGREGTLDLFIELLFVE